MLHHVTMDAVVSGTCVNPCYNGCCCFRSMCYTMLQWMLLLQEHVLVHVTMDAVVSGACVKPCYNGCCCFRSMCYAMLQWMLLFQEHVLRHVTMDAVVSGTCVKPCYNGCCCFRNMWPSRLWMGWWRTYVWAWRSVTEVRLDLGSPVIAVVQFTLLFPLIKSQENTMAEHVVQWSSRATAGL